MVQAFADVLHAESYHAPEPLPPTAFSEMDRKGFDLRGPGVHGDYADLSGLNPARFPIAVNGDQGLVRDHLVHDCVVVRMKFLGLAPAGGMSDRPTITS